MAGKPQRLLLLGGVHRAVVTVCDPDGIDGVSLDRDLLAAAGILEHEKVELLNLTSGARLSACVTAAPRASGQIGAHGATAQLFSVGDLLAVMAYGWFKEKAATSHRPKVLRVDERNRPVPAAVPKPPARSR